MQQEVYMTTFLLLPLVGILFEVLRIHVSSIISTQIKVFKEINEIIQDFIWNSKTSKLLKAILTDTMEALAM